MNNFKDILKGLLDLDDGKSYWESHITIEARNNNIFAYNELEIIQDEAKKYGWKVSNIHGDPQLGDGDRYYLTRNYPVRNDLKELVIKELDNLALLLQDAFDLNVVRSKVELVVYDRKFKNVPSL